MDERKDNLSLTTMIGDEATAFEPSEDLMRMLMAGASNILDVMLRYKQLMFACSSAMKIVRTKLEILDKEPSQNNHIIFQSVG